MRLIGARDEPFPAAALDGAREQVLDGLRRDGIGLSSFDELFGDERLWDDLRADLGEFVRATEEGLDDPGRRSRGKSYLVRRFLARKEQPRVAADNRWLRLGLSSPILDVVNAYRGESTRLIDFDNWYTIPDPEADTRVKSQQWHRDPWDSHIVKVFIYFNRVGEQAGPFEYVRGSAPGGRYGELWPWQQEGVYPPQDELEAAVAAADRLSATGPAGTVIFCDTSGFHRGGWARTAPRILSVHTYVGRASTKRPRFELDGTLDADLSPAARLALSRD